MEKKPQLITGGTHADSRGLIRFVNDFSFDSIKRFYLIEHSDTSIIRAWQGHKREQKWFYVTEGSFQLVVVKLDDWVNPSFDLPPIEFELTTNKPEILHVPGGYVNGFKALIPNSKIMIFTDFGIEDAGTDDYRYESQLWYNWNKK